MTTYKTPDVYVEELSVFPPSVAEVETAVPAFIGYTEKALRKGVVDVTMVPTEITSFLDYEATFGGPPPIKVNAVELDLNNAVTKADVESTFYMYDSLRLFFQNGGGKCYIISIGSFKASPKKDDFLSGLDALRKQDEPTIILFPDGIFLGEGIYDVQQQALKQCGELMDRFAVFDMLEKKSDPAFGWKEGYREFRDRIGINSLKYGAAYTPHLKTALKKTVRYKDIKDGLKKAGVPIGLKKLTDEKELMPVIDNVDNVLKDNDVINGDKGLPEFLKGDKGPTLKAGYSKKVIEFRGAANTELAKEKASDRNADPVRDAFKALFIHIYDVADGLIDEWAKTGTSLTDYPPPLPDKEPLRLETVVTEVRNLTANQLAAAFVKVNGWNKNMAAKIGGTADTVNELYKKPYKWTAAAWGDTFTASKVVEDNSIYPLAGADADEQIRNMLAAEAKLSEQFDVLEGAVAIIARSAEKYLKLAEDGLKTKFPLFQNILDKVETALTIVPPSGVIAGIYSMVDSARGVWKAPANVSLASIIGVTELIDSKAQEDLNVDVVAGKSINVIRPFTGKGVLVWGARTLAGNDNEWRYVSVRRFFNMVEESVKKSTYWAVFEPNDANTWVKVRGMIENYLMQKWREGALAGAAPKDAFFVRCGLGTTMNSQDILEGRMNVEIGMAVVRPAEFIILKFSHKLQTS